MLLEGTTIRVWLLSALLALAQLGAAVHALSHAGASMGEGGLPSDHACALCTGYSQLGAAAANPLPPVFSSPVAAQAHPCVQQHWPLPAPASPYRGRAPPVLS